MGECIYRQPRLLASSSVYDGILFYSARAVPPELRDQIRTGSDFGWELNEACGFTAEKEALKLQKDLSIQNVVAFSGARLTSAISEFRTGNEPWRPKASQLNSIPYENGVRLIRIISATTLDAP